jgi:hypothetical protein
MIGVPPAARPRPRSLVTANRLYYQVKPYLPWGLRMVLRRLVARRRRKTFQDVWPINESAGRPHAEWPGWPAGKKFAFVLTHDVEGPAGLAKCRQLMQLDKELGFRACFNFIPEGDYAVSRELRTDLIQDGFEVGVHDLRHDGRLYQSRRAFSENAKWINHYLKEWGATGFRSGFMLSNLEWLHELNIQYDTSTFDTDPFEPQPTGVGTIFPFWVQCPDSEKGYVELPYTLPQDSTMFIVLREPTPEIWLQKLDWIARKGGMALVNVHPDYLNFGGSTSRSTYSVEKYKDLLRYILEKYPGEYWHAQPKQIADFYQATMPSQNCRDQMDQISGAL